MVVKSCPMCKGMGHLQIVPPNPEGEPCVKVNPQDVIQDFRAGLSCRQVAKKHRISAETARVIRNGTWAGFRKTIRKQ